MSSKPLLSICCITYNQEKFIRQCLEGFVMQKTNFEFEILVFDDASNDNSQNIILEYSNEYDNMITFLQAENQWSKGRYGLLEWLFPAAKGKYIALCEGDDYWTDPLKLQKQVDFLEANPDYVLCFHPVSILKTNGEIVDDFITKVPENYETIETLARLGNYIHTPSVVFRNIIKEFPFEFSQSPIGDYFLYMMLAEQGKLKYLEEKMAVYRYGVGILSSMNMLKTINSNITLYTCMASYFKDEKLKKIFLERQIKISSMLHYKVHDEYKHYFVSGHYFFKFIKFINLNYGHPSIIIDKIRSKMFDQ